MNKGLTTPYMAGYHKRDDEVRALEDRLDEARLEVESAHELATEFLIPRAEKAERRARVAERALAIERLADPWDCPLEDSRCCAYTPSLREWCNWCVAAAAYAVAEVEEESNE